MDLLIIDDSITTRKIISQFAKTKGHTVVGEAADASEAIEIFQRNRPDAITLDMVMPNIDGVECIQRIMEIDQTVKIVVISALVAQENVSNVMDSGAKGFIQKPFNNKSLERAFKILSEP